MKARLKSEQLPTARPAQLPQVAFRLKPETLDRIEKLVQASKRTKTSLLEEAVEKVLPDLERQYKADLATAA